MDVVRRLYNPFRVGCIRGGVRSGAVPLAMMVHPFRLERAACLRRGFGRQAALRPLAFFQYECYFGTMIYLVASRLAFKLPKPFPVSHPNSH